MYSYENYVKVKEELERRRTSAIAAAEEKNEELRRLSPEVRKIDEELSATGMLIFKTACSGGDITPIRKRNEQLTARRTEIILSLGLPKDYTEVHYSCPKCSDSGYVGTAMCKCLREDLIRATIQSSGIGNLIDKQSFDNFSLDYYKDSPEVYERMKNNLYCAKEYVRRFSERPSQLLLIGKTGTGKTHITTAIAREIISQGYDVIYDSVQNIISDFESDKFRSGWVEREPKSEKYLECDLLIIDDLGTEFQTSFTVPCLYNLLNTRQNSGKATIISSNYSPDELRSKYDDRIYSRLIGRGSDVLIFEGKDRRIFR